MPVDTKLNIFSGEDALEAYYDPDQNIPVPLVELPSRMNPLRHEGVRIYAKLLSHLPASNVKSLPALNMLMKAREKGLVTPDTHTIVEYSSGSTIISLGILSHIFGIPKVKAYVSNKTSEIKLSLLRFFGLELTLFGGPVQPEPNDPNGGIHVATIDGQQPGTFNPDQYSNPDNYGAHMRWTGPQIHAQLPNISVLAASVGTSGTLTGTSLYLKSVRPSVVGLGVLTAPNDRVPGPRTYNLLVPVEFPWREAMDAMEEVNSHGSYEKSLELCRNGLLVGPSSGLALVGLLQYLQKRKTVGTLGDLKNSEGEIPCVFICCDQPFQYIGEYFDKLGPSYFHPINNAELFSSDYHPYNIDWEPTPKQITSLLKPGAIMIDFRNKNDFKLSHLDGAYNLDVGADSRPNPFRHTETLVWLFDVLKSRLSATDPEFGTFLEGKRVILFSGDGNVARLACSILRSRGVEAFCVTGGVEAMIRDGVWPRNFRAQM